MRRVAFILCTAFLSLATAASSASFDCSDAATKVEETICADPELSKLDVLLASTYSSYQPTGNEEKTVSKLMLEWRRSRDKCGTNAMCLGIAYKAWIRSLTQNDIVEQLASPNWADGFCTFMVATGDPEATYVCYENVYDLSSPKSACQLDDKVYQIKLDLKAGSFRLADQTSVAFYLRSEPQIFDPELSYKMLGIPMAFGGAFVGRDHHATGCTLHSCDSFRFEKMTFSTTRQYFWLSPEEWEPTVYPEATMFVVEGDKYTEYPNAGFCRFF